LNRFAQREVARAVRGVTDAGAAVHRVEIDPASGKISVIIARPGADARDDASPWDQATQELLDAKGSGRRT
jgi:hypothetical protein